MRKGFLLSPLIIFILFLAGYEIYTSNKGRELFTAAHIVEGLNLATAIKMQVMEYYSTQGEFPDSNADLGLPSPRLLSGRSVKSIEVSMGGKITVTYKNAIKKDASIVLIPNIPSGYSLQGIEWVCTTETIDQSVFANISAPCFYSPPSILNELVDAVVAANEAQVQSAINHGADINAILHGDSPLALAISHDRYAIARQLVAAGANVNQKALLYNGMSPLMQAASLGREKLAALLLDHGAEIDAVDNMGRTALMYAAKNGRKPVTELLLSRGANPLLTDNRGRDAIKYAKRYGRGTGNDKLIENAQQRYSTLQMLHDRASGVGNIMRAARQGDVENIRQLLQAGESVEVVDSNNASALHYAAESQQYFAVKALLEAGIDANGADRDGNTPLLLAVKNGARDIVAVLIQSGAKVNVVDRYRNTPLLMAIRFGYTDIVKLLLNAGASESANKALYESFVSPASSESLLDIQSLILDSGLILDYGAQNVESLLLQSIKANRILVVRFLLENGVSLNELIGVFPLQLAVQSRSYEIVRFLVGHGVRIDAVDEEGKTALMFAVETGQIHLVKYLLDAGANVDVIDKNGLTALRMAKANYSEDIVELLRQHKK